MNASSGAQLTARLLPASTSGPAASGRDSRKPFLDIRVTHPRSNLLSRSEVNGQLTNHENQKKRQYSERVNVVDRGVFTPLVFSTSGMVGRECSTFMKAVVSALVDKHPDLKYSVVMSQLRCKLSFCLLRWIITCLRGCRFSYRRRHVHSFANECRLINNI